MKHQYKHERMMDTETTGVSFRTWLLELVDHIAHVNGKTRSAIVKMGVKKHIIANMKIGFLQAIMKKLSGVNGNGKSSITISIPSWFVEVADQHCDLNGYGIDNFFYISALKYLLIKDDPEELWDMLYNEMYEASSKDTFKGLLS